MASYLVPCARCSDLVRFLADGPVRTEYVECDRCKAVLAAEAKAEKAKGKGHG